MRSPWQLREVCREEQLVQYVTTSTDHRTGPLQGVLGLGCAAAGTAPRILITPTQRSWLNPARIVIRRPPVGTIHRAEFWISDAILDSASDHGIQRENQRSRSMPRSR